MLAIISWLILGALVGWIASKIAGTDSQQGWILNIVLGIVGAFVGGLIYEAFADDDFSFEWSIGSILIAILGGVIVSWGFAYLTKRRA
ncbi:GlsB/YeaQ/YmgE family stress response membrane protein [soil metagenome]